MYVQGSHHCLILDSEEISDILYVSEVIGSLLQRYVFLQNRGYRSLEEEIILDQSTPSAFSQTSF